MDREMPAKNHAHSEAVVDCSVLVPVYNEERYIARSIAAMRRQQFPGRIEIVCADGGSNDRTRDVLARLAKDDARIRLVDNPRRTVSSGLNVALGHARGRWVARMDAHTEYPSDYLATGIKRLERGDTRWVSGPQTPRGEGPVSSAVTLALGSLLGRGGSRKWGTEGSHGGPEHDLDTGVFAGVWPREVLLDYGGWDERWRVNEDGEMAARFLARSERLICIPAMAAAYSPRDSIPGLWRQYLTYGEYRFKTARAHPDTLRRSNLLPPAVVIDVGLSLLGPRSLRRSARAGLLVYGIAIVGAGVEALPRADRHHDARLVPLVLGVMHLAHGFGALRSVVRNGPPLAALVNAAGCSGLARHMTPASEPVFAPSLSVEPGALGL